jgi:hypothetical protein
MKTKLILSTRKSNFEQWTNLPIIPRLKEWFNVEDILKIDEITEIKESSHNWSGIKGVVQSVEYRHDDNDFYTEIKILCED